MYRYYIYIDMIFHIYICMYIYIYCIYIYIHVHIDTMHIHIYIYIMISNIYIYIHTYIFNTSYYSIYSYIVQPSIYPCAVPTWHGPCRRQKRRDSCVVSGPTPFGSSCKAAGCAQWHGETTGWGNHEMMGFPWSYLHIIHFHGIFHYKLSIWAYPHFSNLQMMG